MWKISFCCIVVEIWASKFFEPQKSVVVPILLLPILSPPWLGKFSCTKGVGNNSGPRNHHLNLVKRAGFQEVCGFLSSRDSNFISLEWMDSWTSFSTFTPISLSNSNQPLFAISDVWILWLWIFPPKWEERQRIWMLRFAPCGVISPLSYLATDNPKWSQLSFVVFLSTSSFLLCGTGSVCFFPGGSTAIGSLKSFLVLDSKRLIFLSLFQINVQFYLLDRVLMSSRRSSIVKIIANSKSSESVLIQLA